MRDPGQIITQLEQFDTRLFDAIEKILGLNPSKEQILEFLSSDQFDQLLDELGLNQIVDDYVKGFNLEFREQVRDYNPADFQKISDNLELIKASNERTILGYVGFYKEQLRTKLISSIIEGVNINVKAQREEMFLNMPKLTAPQLGTVINTSYADFSRATTAEIFEDRPEQRFYYQEGIPASAPQKSEICRWLLENQKPKGYTMAEINKGIQTPFGIVNFGGRVPNFNCTDQWLPL